MGLLLSARSTLGTMLKAKLAKYSGKGEGSLLEMLKTNWYLGMTSFGGPAVHFQIFHRMFVDKLQWLDEQTYREMFALTQSLPGPASTKMIYAINIFRSGHLSGLLAFLMWSAPGGVGACAMAVGAARIKDPLPLPVYALLSGSTAPLSASSPSAQSS